MITLSEIYKELDYQLLLALGISEEDINVGIRAFQFTDTDKKTYSGYTRNPYAEEDKKSIDIYIDPSYGFGDVDEGELGYNGSSPRTSVYIVAIYVFDSYKIDNALSLAEVVEKYFRRKTIDNCIMCQNPYTTMVGKNQDNSFSCYVTIPFVTWTENQ